MNGLQICGRSDRITNVLKIKAKANCLKSIANPTQIVLHPMNNHKVIFRLRYVMPSSLIGIGSRSPVIVCNNMYCKLKGARYFTRTFSTVGLDGSSKIIAQELERLRECSVKNNIDEVNSIVKSLLGNPDF